MLERVLEVGADHVDDAARPNKGVPAVEAEKAAEVDAEAREPRAQPTTPSQASAGPAARCQIICIR